MIDEEKPPMGGMDTIEEQAPPPEQPEQREAREQRERDGQGRFAPKIEGAKGKPDGEAARRREAAERDEYKAKYETLDTSYQALNKRLEDMARLAKGDAADTKPDPLAELSGKVDKIAQGFDAQNQAREKEAAWTSVRAYADQDEARFRGQRPDFPEAVNHYIGSRLNEMKALGFNKGQAERALTEEAKTLLLQCAQTSRSPAETLYSMAEARGYAPGAQAYRPQPASGGGTPGGRSFGTAAGAGGTAVTADQIARMSEDDYNSFRATAEGRRAIQRAMGG